MKLALIVVVVSLASAFLAHFLFEDFGYVIIHFRGYFVEMSVPMLLALLVLLFFTVWLVRRIIQAPRLLGEAAGRYRAGRAGQKLTRGMIEVAEGNFARGEKLLARAAATSDTPLFNLLQAARAAHLQGEDARRDEWLKLAYERTPGAANAVLLTQAELQLDRKQYEQALATLRRIDENSRDHSYALALLGRLYFRLGDWQALGEILPRVTRHGRVRQETLDKWAIRVHRENLDQAPDGDAVITEWKRVPKRLKADMALAAAYYENLMRTGMHEKAEKDLASALASDWRGPLVRLYGLVEAPDASKQLKRAEGWLAKHGEDPDLLLAAARLCLRNELWGKARSYLETVLSLRPSAEAYQVYGRLLTKLGETDAAADAYRAGLTLVTEEPLPAIPHLAPDED
ncbi:MAG: heme biosynthesis HemY N-terminal domain-containing protein [Woeseiaceae bacterium]|nr:heme biosynthesis HemY N-terminal domain-containing protein [Woeseiaceae bacterium]